MFLAIDGESLEQREKRFKEWVEAKRPKPIVIPDVPIKPKVKRVKILPKKTKTKSVPAIKPKVKTPKKKYPSKPQTPAQYRERKYNLLEQDYNILLEKQNYACAICNEPFGDKSPAVDHDHNCCVIKGSCGKCIRGLLCLHCNSGLGYFKDDSGRLAKAISYLDKNGHP